MGGGKFFLWVYSAWWHLCHILPKPGLTVFNLKKMKQWYGQTKDFHTVKTKTCTAKTGQVCKLDNKTAHRKVITT